MSEQNFKPAWRSFYWHFITIIVLFIVTCAVSAELIPEGSRRWQEWLWSLAVGLIICVVISLICKRNSLVLIVKPDKVALESGLIGRQSVEVNMRSIRSIQIRQSIVQRMLNVGDIMVISAGDEYEIVAVNMPNPHEIRESIHITGRDDAREEKQQEAGE